MSHETHLRRALNLAAAHSAGGQNGPFGAVVVLEGEVVGEGWNQVVSSSDPTAHAEVVAIRKACGFLGTHDLSGAVLYSSCEPCPMCLSAIYWARLGTVIYAASAADAREAGFDDGWILQELRKDWPDRTVERVQLMEDEGRQVLQGWLENPRKVPY